MDGAGLMERQSDTREALLETFRQECDTKLGFLEKAHAAKKEFGLSKGDVPVATLDPPTPDELSGSFLAVQRYRLKNAVIEVVYGDRDFVVQARAFFPLSGGFGLFEILRAAGIEDAGADGDSLVCSKDAIQRIVSAIAAALERHFTLLTNPGIRILGRAQEIRRQQRREEKVTHRRAFLVRARNEAAAEFRNRNYGKVVGLLAPFEDILSAADREKVRLARKYTADGS
jgi:hypothetical protein